MRGMNSPKPLQIFKTGKHTAMSGVALSFSESDLAATAAAYDVAKHEAPLVCGHPQHDAPAYGWVQSLRFAEGALDAQPAQVNADFAELVASGAFKKISASFYAPDSPSNPVPGVFYLRHVGFLGAQPPAVKGMRNPSFAENEQGIVEFSEWDDVDNASLWRGLRDWILAKFGQDEADKAVSGYTVKNLEQAAQDELKEAQQPAGAVAPAFTEKGMTVSPEEKAALEAENASLKARLAAADAQAKATHIASVHAANAAFAEGLVSAGTLLPVHQAVAVATLNHLATAEQVVEFGEGATKQPLLDALKGLFTAMPKRVEFSELAGSASTVVGAAELTPHDIAAQAVAFQEAEFKAGRQLTTAQAVQHIVQLTQGV